MKFQYIGDNNDPPQKIEFMGLYEFELNGPYVDVSEDRVINKLKGNKCFKKLTREKKPTIKLDQVESTIKASLDDSTVRN